MRAYAQAGGQILFGTDVGYMTDYDPAEEYRLMARALTPMQILASLTTAPAARWKEEARRGRVAGGSMPTWWCWMRIRRPMRRISRRCAARSAAGRLTYARERLRLADLRRLAGLHPSWYLVL